MNQKAGLHQKSNLPVFDLGLLILQTVRNDYLLVKSYQIYGIFYGSSSELRYNVVNFCLSIIFYIFKVSITMDTILIPQ
jgi:hypothetical protein